MLKTTAIAGLAFAAAAASLAAQADPYFDEGRDYTPPRREHRYERWYERRHDHGRGYEHERYEHANEHALPNERALPKIPVTAHGFVSMRNGIILTGPVIMDIFDGQNAYIKRLKNSLNAFDLNLVKDKQDEIANLGPLSERDQIWFNAQLIGFMVRLLEPGDAVTIRAHNFALLGQYAAHINAPFDPDDVAEGETPSWVTRPPVFSKPERAKLFGRMSEHEYLEKCRAEGVPIPPPWGSPAWSRDTIGNPLNISYLTPPGDNPKALSEIYWYIPKSGPDGLCLALPIIADTTQSNGKADALGIICQGLSTLSDTQKSNSRACFWDNNGPVEKFPAKPIPIDSNYFISPPHLPDDNQCTDCHAGENAFITHPKTRIDNASSIDNAKTMFNKLRAGQGRANFISQNNWYRPIVQHNWPQNHEPGPAPNGNGICVSCHNTGYAGRLPDVDRGLAPRDHLFKYCSFLLPNVLAKTEMSPYSHASMTNLLSPPDPNDITNQYNACAGIFPPPPFFPQDEGAWRQHINPPK